MALSIERKVEVRTGVISPVVSENIQNCLLLSDQDKFINHGIKEYTSATDVSNDFGVDSREVNFAKSYFKSFVGATKRPEKLLIAENYSKNALPSSITSSFFTSSETPEEKLKNIGETGATGAIVISEDIPILVKNIMVSALKELDGNTPSKAYLIGKTFDAGAEENPDPTIDDTFQKLNNITGANIGDFSIVFNVNGEEKIATATNIDLGEIQSIEEAFNIIKTSINTAIDNTEDLGSSYNIELLYNLETLEKYNFSVSTVNTGAQYKIVRVFSTVPTEITNISDTLQLSQNFEPTIINGSNGISGDFSIKFDVNGEEKIATAVGLNFSLYNDLDAQLNYLETQINNAITNAEGLGADYLVEITTKEEDEDYFSVIIQTQNVGEKYKILEIISSELAEFQNVANILSLSDDYNPSFYNGSDKELGDFSVLFKINNDKRITATAKNLDFSSYNTLDEQLNYLTNEINKVIIATDDLGNDYTVTIKKNNLTDDMYNVSISTNSYGSKYNIEFVSSRVPLDEERVDTILKLNINSIPRPTVMVGRDNTPLSEVLNKYSNDRSDWWTIATANQNINIYNQISDWVNEQNNFARYMFIAHDDNNLAKTTSANPDTFGFSIYTSGKKGITTVFGDETLAGFVAGVAASIDYELENGTLTFSGRRQNGFTPTVSLDTEANLLETNYYNYYGSYSSVNPKYNFFETGVVSGADGLNWIDSFLNQIWLRKQLQDALLNLLIDKKKIPFTDEGYAIIANTCDYVAAKGISNGIISRGVNLSEDQIALVNAEVGKDVSDNLQTYGYYVLIGENTSTDRLKRIARNCKMFYCDGGSIQTIKMVVNTIL